MKRIIRGFALSSWLILLVGVIGLLGCTTPPPLARGNDCYVAGNGIPLPPAHCETMNRAGFFTCDEADPDDPYCNPKLHGYGVDYGPTPGPDGPDEDKFLTASEEPVDCRCGLHEGMSEDGPLDPCSSSQVVLCPRHPGEECCDEHNTFIFFLPPVLGRDESPPPPPFDKY